MIVIDCAVAVDAITAVNGSEGLRAALTDEDLHAPALLDFEVVSALRELTLRTHITPARPAMPLPTSMRCPSSGGPALRRCACRHSAFETTSARTTPPTWSSRRRYSARC